MADQVTSNSEVLDGSVRRGPVTASSDTASNEVNINNGQQQGSSENGIEVQQLNNMNNNNIQQQFNNQFGMFRTTCIFVFARARFKFYFGIIEETLDFHTLLTRVTYFEFKNFFQILRENGNIFCVHKTL